MQGRPKEGAALYLEALATLKKRVCAGLGVEVLFLGVHKRWILSSVATPCCRGIRVLHLTMWTACIRPPFPKFSTIHHQLHPILVSIFATAFLGGTFPETHGRILSQTLNEKAAEGDEYDVVEPCTACSTPKWDHKMQLWVFLKILFQPVESNSTH